MDATFTQLDDFGICRSGSRHWPGMMTPPLPSPSPHPSRPDPPSRGPRRPGAAPVVALPVVALIEELLHPDTRPRVRVRPCDADDVLQDALLLFVERHERIRPASWRAWVLGTLRNRERELFKRQALWRKYESLLEAHLQDHAPRGAEPDVAIRQQQVLLALVWLLDQVEPSRRDVTERVLFDGLSLEAIAAETGVPLGTVRSRWTRAKRDMRDALDRERARLDDVFVAIMLSVLGAWALWIARRVRRAARDLVAALGRQPSAPAGRSSAGVRGAQPSSPQRPSSEGRSHPWRVRIGAMFACALLPLVVIRHIAAERLDAFTTGADSSAETASFDANAATPDDTVHAARAARAAHDDDLLVLLPFLSTHAERERDRGSHRATLPAAPSAGGPLRSAPASPRGESRDDSEAEIGRGLLDRANTALHEGDERMARDALRLYDEDFPRDPFPALRAQVANALASRRTP